VEQEEIVVFFVSLGKRISNWSL